MSIYDFAILLLQFYRYGFTIVLVVLYCCFKNIDKYHRALLLYLTIMLLVEYTMMFMGWLKQNNQMVLPLYSLADLAFFVYFYSVFFLSKKSKNIFFGFFVLAAVFVVGEFVLFFLLHTLDVKSYQPFSKIVVNIVILAMVLNVFSAGFSEKQHISLRGFWFNIVMLLFFTVNTMFFLPFDFFVNAPLASKFYFWAFHTTSVIFFYGYLSVTIAKHILPQRRYKTIG